MHFKGYGVEGAFRSLGMRVPLEGNYLHVFYFPVFLSDCEESVFSLVTISVVVLSPAPFLLSET